MKWLCWFKMCNWIWILNIDKDNGLYQCSRCKVISWGCPKEKEKKPLKKVDKSDPLWQYKLPPIDTDMV